MTVFGYKTRPKATGHADAMCAIDGRVTPHSRVAMRKWLTVFSIPLFPRSTDADYAVCDSCGKRTIARATRIDWSHTVPHLAAR